MMKVFALSKQLFLQLQDFQEPDSQEMHLED